MPCFPIEDATHLYVLPPNTVSPASTTSMSQNSQTSPAACEGLLFPTAVPHAAQNLSILRSSLPQFVQCFAIGVSSWPIRFFCLCTAQPDLTRSHTLKL